jgi:fucose permease
MDPGQRRLFIALLLNFIVFGVTVTMYGATVPKVIREFDWSYLATGVVLSASAVGYFLSSFLSGFLVQRFGPKKVVLLGLLLQAVGLSLFGSAAGVLFNLCATFLVGLGHGGTEVVTNVCVVRMESPGQSRLMNLMHAAFPVGAILGPILVGQLIAAGLVWQLTFRAIAVVTFGIALGFVFLSFGSVLGEKEEEEERRHLGFSRLIRNPLLFFLFLTIFLYVGAEIGVSSWIAEYYVEVFGPPVSVGAYVISVFWLGILIGRLGMYLAYHGYRQAEILLVMSCVAVSSLAVSLLIGNATVAGVGFFVSGLGYSGVYPVVMAIVGEEFKRGQSVALGFVSMGGGIGSFSFPFIMAAIANTYGISTGFRFYATVTLAMAGAAGLVLWLVRGRVGEPAP